MPVGRNVAFLSYFITGYIAGTEVLNTFYILLSLYNPLEAQRVNVNNDVTCRICDLSYLI